MLISEEDAFICDLAEYYHVHDMESYSVNHIAILLTGLREDSRTIMRLTDRKIPLDLMVGVLSYDTLNLLLWSKTKDGHEGINRPKRLLDILLGVEKKDDIEAFDSGEELLEAFKKITRE